MAPVDETLSLEDIAAAQTSLCQLMTGFWGARTLHAAVRLDLFNRLNARPMKAAELAVEIPADARATEMLLNALVSLGLLEKDESAYKNSPVGQIFLVKGSDYYQGQLIAMYSDDWELWQRLDEAVRKGGPPGYVPPVDNETVRAMNDSAAVTAPLAIKKLDLSRLRRVLDVGSGPATFSIALARALPDAEITVIESPQAALVTREYLQNAGLAQRVRIETGDYHSIDFGREKYDLVLLSSIMHTQSVDECRKLFKKAFEALANEGQCVAHEFLLRDDKTGPLMSTLFALNTMLHTDQGRTYSGWEITDYMQTEGFIRVQIVPLEPTPFSLVVGTRP